MKKLILSLMTVLLSVSAFASEADLKVPESIRSHTALYYGFIVTFLGDFYVTMGPQSVMTQVRDAVMIVNGKGKAAMVKQAFFGPVTEDVPSSILQLHPNFTLILDADAASELNL